MMDDTQFLKQMSYYQNSTSLNNLDLLTSIISNNLHISAAWYQNTDGTRFNVPEYFKPTKSRSFNTQLYINMLDDGESGASAREWVQRTAPFIWNLFLRSRAGKKYRPKKFKRKNKRDYKRKSYTNMDTVLEQLGLPVEDEGLEGGGVEQTHLPTRPEWFRPAGNDDQKNNEIYNNLYYNTNNCREEYKNYTDEEIATDPNKKILKDAYYQFLLSEDYYTESQFDNQSITQEDENELKQRILLHRGIEYEDQFSEYQDALKPQKDISLLQLVRELYTKKKEKRYNRVRWHLHEYTADELKENVRLTKDKDGNYVTFYTNKEDARNRPCKRCKELDNTDYSLSDFVLHKIHTDVPKYTGSPIYDYSHPGCNCYLELYRVFEDGEPNAGERDISVKPLYINALGASYNINKVLEPAIDQVIDVNKH